MSPLPHCIRHCFFRLVLPFIHPQPACICLPDHRVLNVSHDFVRTTTGRAFQDISTLRRQRMHINSQISELEHILEGAKKDLGAAVSEVDLERFAKEMGFMMEEDGEAPECV